MHTLVIVLAHRHGMRVVLSVQLGWSGLLSASLASLGVLAAHLDQRGVIGAWSTVARGGRGLRVRLHLLVTEPDDGVRTGVLSSRVDCNVGEKVDGVELRTGQPFAFGLFKGHHLVIAPSLDRAQRRQRPLVIVEAVVAQHAALQPDQAQALSKARLKRVSSADQFREGG